MLLLRIVDQKQGISKQGPEAVFSVGQAASPVVRERPLRPVDATPASRLPLARSFFESRLVPSELAGK